MPLGTALIAAEKLATAVAGANVMKDVALHFENMSDTALPYLVLSSILKTRIAQESHSSTGMEGIRTGASLTAGRGESTIMTSPATGTALQDMPTQHLPNENLWSCDSPQTYTRTSIDGTTTEKTISLQFRTIDKDISSFVNVHTLMDTLAEGHVPTMEQVYLAVLDIVDALDLGILGTELSATRLEPHVKDRKLTVKETVTHKADFTAIPLKDNLKQIGKKEDSFTQTVTLEGEGLGVKTLLQEEAKQVQTQYHEITESERTRKDRLFGGEVETTQRAYVKTEASHTRLELDADGNMREVFANKDARVDDIFKLSDKEWRNGYVSYVPLVGAGVNIIRKYQLGVQVQTGDWVRLAVDAVSVTVLVAPFIKAAKASLHAASVTKNVATTQAKNSLSKAALNPKNAVKELKKFYANPRAVFSPERIAAKTKVVAHNPMKSDMLKSLAELSKLDKQGVNIRQFLRQEFADMGKEGKLIADSLTRNLRYLKQNGWLTPENISRMGKGLNPQGWLKDAVNKPFRLDVDHIIPKSLAPELKAHPGNLRFLPQIDNIMKSNNVLRHVVQHVNKFKEVFPTWKPSPGLLEKILDYGRTHPWLDMPDMIRKLNAVS